MKKKVLVGLLVLSLAALLAVGVWAWFTAKDGPKTNQFTAGTLEISINDVFTTVDNWNPGDTTEKKVSVTNDGSKCAYVRVKLTPEWGAMVGDEFAADSSLATTNVILDVNTDDWVPASGWYYYKSSLAKNDETPLLLRSVELSGPATGNAYQGKVFQIKVEAEAVQCTNDAYQEVWQGQYPSSGWPAD